MEREGEAGRQPDFFVAFAFTLDAEQEYAAFFKRTGRVIKLLTAQAFLDETHVQKMQIEAERSPIVKIAPKMPAGWEIAWNGGGRPVIFAASARCCQGTRPAAQKRTSAPISHAYAHAGPVVPARVTFLDVEISMKKSTGSSNVARSTDEICLMKTARTRRTALSSSGLVCIRPLVAAVALVTTSTSSWGQLTLSGSSYTQDFNAIGTGLPTGWVNYSNATATALGNVTSLTTAATAWNTNSTPGGFYNFASAVSPLTSTSNSATQAASTNRALGWQAAGDNGRDPGAAIALRLANTNGLGSFNFSFDAQSYMTTLTRTITISLQYGLGVSPTSFTTISSSTYTTSNTWGSTTLSGSIPAAINNQSGDVWLRIVQLNASSGSGARPPIGFDNFSLTYSPITAAQYWDANGATGGIGGSGTWSTGDTNWSSSAAGDVATVAFSASAPSVFAGAGGAVTVDSVSSSAQIQFAPTSGSYALSGGTLTLNTGSSIDTAASTSTTIGSTLAGSAGLTKTGTGTLVLTGANTYTGGTIIAGTLQVGTGATSGQLGAGNVSIASGGKLAMNRSDSQTIAGNITGAGALDVLGGTVVLTGTNSYTGATTVSPGATLQIGNSAAAGTFGAGAIANSGTIRYSRTDSQTLATGITGTGALVISSGTLVLSGSNMFDAGVTINNGAALTIGSGSTGEITAGSILNDGALTHNRSNANTFDRVISGGGSVTFAGSGVTTVTGSNAYTGGTSLSASGRVRIANDSALGSGTVTMGSGSLLSSSNTTARTLTNSFVIAGDSTLGSSSDSGTLNLSGGVQLTGNRQLTISSAVAISGDITEDVAGRSLTKAGSGTTLTLSGNNSYTGGTIVSNGTLALGASNALQGNVTVSASGATFAIGSFSDSIGVLSMTSAGSVTGTSGVLSPTSTTVSNSSGTASITANLGGAGALTRSGGGSLTLSGTNSYAGGTFIPSGTLTLGSAAALPNGGNLTIGSTAAGEGELSFGSLTNSTITIGSLALFPSTSSATFVSVSATNSLRLGGDVSLSNTTSSAGNQFPLVASGAGSIDLNAGSSAGFRDVTIAGQNNSGGDLQIGVILSGQSGLRFTGTPSTFNASDATLTLSAANTYTGSTVVNRGRLLVTGNDSIPATSVLTLAAAAGQTATAEFGNVSNIFAGLSSSSAGTNTITGGTNPSLIVLNVSADQSFAGIIAGGSSSMTLTKRGTGKQTLSGTSSTYVGRTTIEAGTLSIASIKNTSSASSIGAPTSVAAGTIAVGLNTTGGTLQYTGAGDVTNRVINLAGTTGGATLDQSGGGVLEFTSAFTATGAGSKTLTLTGSTSGVGRIAGAIVNNSGSNTTSVSKQGTGIWELAGANTYSGSTTLTNGTLRLGANSLGTVASITSSAVGRGSLILNGGTLSSNGSAARTLLNPVTLGGDVVLGDSTNNGALAFSGAATLTGTRQLTVNSDTSFGGVIDGSGFGLTKAGAGTLTLGGTNTYTGKTTITNGMLSVTGSLANTAAVSVEGGTYDVAASDTVGAVTLKSGTISGTGTLTGSSYAVESGSISAKLAGGGGLTKTTAGTVTLSGANTYTGITNVAEGALTLASTASITSNAEVANGATLSFDNGAELTGDVGVSGTLTGAVNVDGNVTVNASGTLTGDALITGDLAVNGSLSPGASPGYVLADSVTFGDSASTLMEIESLSSFDLVEAVNTMSYDGALTIDISGTYAEGSSFDLFDFAGTASGDFNSISLTGSYGSTLMSGAGTWTATLGSTLFTFTGSTGVLSLSAQAIPEPLTAAGVILLASRVLGRRARVSL